MILTIITPSYNQGDYIEQTIRSVLNQKGDFAIEYIIIDGGSSDNTVQIIKQYDELLKEGRWKIRCNGIDYKWLSEKDRGQSDAINKGFSMAKGNVGTWLNSDDYFFNEEVFQSVVNYFTENPELSLVVGNGKLVSHEGLEFGDYATAEINVRELLYLDWHINQPSAFFRLECWENHPIEVNFRYCMDADFFLSIVCSQRKWLKVPEFWSAFRFYPENKTCSGGKARLKEQNAIMRKYADSRICHWFGCFYRWVDIVYYGTNRSSRTRYEVYKKLRAASYQLILGKQRP